MPKPETSLSIRRRIFVVAACILTGVMLVLVAFLHDYAERAADRSFDRLLTASVLTIAGAVQVEHGSLILELPSASLAMLSRNEHVFYTVRDGNGTLITGYGDLDAGMRRAESSEPVFETRRYGAERVRIATVGRLVATANPPTWATIRVAETRGAREQLAAEMLNRSTLPLVVVVGVALGLLWFGVTRAFAPLVMLERELRQRRDDDLSPIAVPVPREVEGLVEALNSFMVRLQTVLDRLTGLVADAAHQIRTPLASLRAQAEVALEETDPGKLHDRIGRIHRNAVHASRLTSQLLDEATITHRLGVRERVAIAVAELVEEMRRCIAPANQPRLVVSLAAELRGIHIRGDRMALREMLRNLADNALLYAPAGPVELAARLLDDGRIEISVADRGPGIQDDEKQAVLERFRRGTNSNTVQAAGSGLGLAIVRAVVAAHGGELALRDRDDGGLLAIVVLPYMEISGMAPARIPRAFGVLAGWVLLGLIAGVPCSGIAQSPPQPPDRLIRFAAPNGDTGQLLTIASPTDTPLFAELAHGFQSAHPDITIVYHEIGTTQLFDAIVARRLPETDVVISTAVDLQVRLANDGFAMPYASPYLAGLPAWAEWRSEVFGFTFEPAVIVYNSESFSAATVPHSRSELLSLLESDPARWYGRIGTYDISSSSAGYLLAMQDELMSSNFWGLASAMGRAGVRLRPTSAEIIDDIEHGRLDLGYNVLGSYALPREASGHNLGVVVPQDYVLVLGRAALIARSAPHPDLARAFIDWLLSPAGQAVAANNAGFGALRDGTPGPWTAASVLARSRGLIQPIALGPSLLVGLDQQRRARFVQNWLRMVNAPGSPAASRTP